MPKLEGWEGLIDHKNRYLNNVFFSFLFLFTFWDFTPARTLQSPSEHPAINSFQNFFTACSSINGDYLRADSYNKGIVCFIMPWIWMPTECFLNSSYFWFDSSSFLQFYYLLLPHPSGVALIKLRWVWMRGLASDLAWSARGPMWGGQSW